MSRRRTQTKDTTRSGWCLWLYEGPCNFFFFVITKTFVCLYTKRFV